jgi:glycine oxidase
VHGQLLAIDTGIPPLRHLIAAGHGYLVPRSDGRLIVGTTAERVGFRRSVTVGGLQRLTSIAVRVTPGTANRPVIAHWAGFRPGTPDGLPILGPDPEMPGLIYATGHFRNGILLAPLTAEIVAALVREEPSPVDLSPYGRDRFGRSEAD